MNRFLSAAALSFLMIQTSSLVAQASRFTPGNGPSPVEITAEIVSMMGTGCPRGGAVATLSPDGSSVSILFDKLSTEIPAGPMAKDQKNCMIRLGFRFTGKYRVAVVGSDARGFVSVPSGGSSTLSVAHYSPFTVNQAILRRMNLSRTFTGPASEEVILHSDFRDVPMWSYCGSQMSYRGQLFPIMTINLTIDSTNNNPSENLIAAIDSLDIGGPSSLTYNLLWTYDQKNCR